MKVSHFFCFFCSVVFFFVWGKTGKTMRIFIGEFSVLFRNMKLNYWKVSSFYFVLFCLIYDSAWFSLRWWIFSKFRHHQDKHEHEKNSFLFGEKFHDKKFCWKLKLFLEWNFHLSKSFRSLTKYFLFSAKNLRKIR